MKLVVVALTLLSLVGVARADTRRIAIIVGNNVGARDRPPLHYAEDDAQKIAATFSELGGVDRVNLFLLRGRRVRDVRAAFDVAQQRIRSWRSGPATHIVLVFFFSGHSDGEALELSDERLDFAEVRRWLAGVGADVRLAIVDSCKSGALLAAKGGRPGPAFAIRLSDDVASSGEALLTSSAADELALESREIHGSFFTHHFVSGLRGAADASGDGTVTLAEAYQYAFSRTVSATASTTIGTQHPAYDYHLSGQGDLVLSDLSRRTAALDLPSGFDRVVVRQEVRDQVMAEIPANVPTRVALPVGRYAIRAWLGDQTLVAETTLHQGEERALNRNDFQSAPSSTAVAKGGDAGRAVGIAIVAGLGVDQAVADGVYVHGQLHLGVSSAKPSGWTTTAMVSTGRGAGFWETTGFVLGGYRLGFERARFRGFVGLEAGVGVVSQNLDKGGALRTPSIGGAPEVGASIAVRRSLSVVAEFQFLAGWIRRDNRDAALLVPAGWVGLSWTL